VVLWIVGLLAALVIGLLTYLSVADLTWVKGRIETAVSESTGRDFRIAGDFDLEVLPEPSVLVEDVTLANADWGSEPAMVKVGHFSARVGLWSLISGPVEVRELRLRDVDVLLETSEQGESNTAMGEPAPVEAPADEEEAAREVPVIVELAEIRNVRIRSISADGEPEEIALEALDINLDDDQNMGLTGNGQALGAPFHLAGTIGPAAALQRAADINVDVEGAVGSLAYSTKGILGDLETLNGTDLAVRLSADEVADLLKTLEVDSPLSGPLAVDLNVRGADDVLEVLTQATAGAVAITATTRHADNTLSFDATIPALDKAGAALDVEGLPPADLTLQGQIVETGDDTRIEGITARIGEALFNIDGNIPRDREATARFDVKAQGPSLQDLSTDLPAVSFAALLSAALSTGAADLDLTEISLGRSDLSGTATIRSGDRTSVEARLTSSLIDLTELLGDPLEESGETTEQTPKEEEPASEFVFTEDPLPFETLRTTDLDIEANFARVERGPRVFNNVLTRVLLAGGVLDFTNRFDGSLGGVYVSDVDLDASKSPAELDMQVNLRDLELNLLSGEDAGPDDIPDTDVTLDIESRGESQRQLAANANGRVLFTQGPGRVENDLVGKVSGDILAQLFSALNPLAKDEEYSNWECTIFSLDIESGLAEINGFLAQGEKIMVVGGGDIDLNTEKLNIEFNTKPRKGVGLSADMFVTPFVKLVGTLSSPTVGLDTKGALLSGGAAVLTGGLSFLVQGMADRASAEGDQCAPTLAEVGDHPAIEE
jgi:uncharacterized protein involved in outer membrane biogenesis